MEIRQNQDITIVVFPPRLDSSTSKDAETELKVCLEGGAQKIIGNFAGTDYVSSAGLRVLFYVAKELKKSNGSIVLTSLNRFTLELFEAAGFTSLFSIFNSEEDALNHFLKK